MRRYDIDDMFDMMRKEMESMFNNFADDFGFALSSPGRALEGSRSSALPAERDRRYRTPVADFWETDKEMVATFELPGVDKNDIDMNIDKDQLEIKVEKKHEEENKKDGSDGYAYMARYAGFYRRIPLPDGVDPEKTKATYNNGVLEVKIPKTEEKARSRKKIDVE